MSDKIRVMIRRLKFIIPISLLAVGISIFGYHNRSYILKPEGLKTISVGTESNDDSCRERETLSMAKACTFLIGNAVNHGTGFAISSEGIIVTNYHVVDYSEDGYADVFFNGKFNKVPIIGFSVEDDLAILAGPPSLFYCEWSDSKDLELAEPVFAIGWPNSPYGDSTITKGIVSRYTKLEGNVEAIQTDTPINPGNSGGPLIDKCGIVGVNTSKIAWIDDSAPSEGIGYAITSNYAQQVIENILKSSTGVPIIPEKKISVSYTKSDKTPEITDNGSSANSLVDTNISYDYEQVIFWEQRKIQDAEVYKSWIKAEKTGAKIDEDQLEDLISALEENMRISEKLWDGYTNSKITYGQVYEFKQKYLENSNKISILTKELNIEGSINAYKNCIDAWQDLEKEYEEDFSEQKKECDQFITFD